MRGPMGSFRRSIASRTSCTSTLATSVIESQLLFREGDAVSRRLFEETERNLRELRYIREPSVTAVNCHDGMADIEVTVREVWTTNPGFSFARSGGENSAGIKLQELNVLGLGKQLTFELSKDADRSFYTVHWRDPGVRESRWVTDLALRQSSDGQGWSAMAERPFYALDSRWSAGFALQQDESVDPVYRLGERVAGYNREAEFAEVRYGRSDGLLNGWSRRTTFGFRREHADFEVAPDEAAPAVLPEDRRLDYPFLRFEAVQDDFETTRNRDQIARTEDQQFGLHYEARGRLVHSGSRCGSRRPPAARRGEPRLAARPRRHDVRGCGADHARRGRYAGRRSPLRQLALLPADGA